MKWTLSESQLRVAKSVSFDVIRAWLPVSWMAMMAQDIICFMVKGSDEMITDTSIFKVFKVCFNGVGCIPWCCKCIVVCIASCWQGNTIGGL